MSDSVSDFCGVTGATPEVGRHFLQITDGDLAQAIQLFFDSPDLASSAPTGSAQSAPPAPNSSTSRAPVGREDENGVVNLDSDMDMDPDDECGAVAPEPRAAGSDMQSGAFEDDEAMARRLQEEMYAGGDMDGSLQPGDVRAPMARTTETLIDPGSFTSSEDMHSSILEQFRSGRSPRSRTGIFNQHPSSASIWESSGSNRREELTETAGRASERSSKAARLAELFRPPFELMSRISWDDARDLGKDDEKWILVNIQDPSIFDCQALNRDIWKHEGIKETVKENFIFMQYSKDDPAGAQYMQYYFQNKDDQNAYPHIAIVDPRTGEQVKVWSGPPSPKSMDFLMQLHEFLDRYSLDPAHKNPVAKRKAEKPAALDVGRLSEEQMMELALQNSLSNGANKPPQQEDPDELTKSAHDHGKGKASAEEETVDGDDIIEETITPSVFDNISADQPHSEPISDAATTTRIQFKHSGGRVVRRFKVADPVRRIYEWLKADPIDGKTGVSFELKKAMGGSDLLNDLDHSIGDAGLKNSTIMVEYLD